MFNNENKFYGIKLITTCSQRSWKKKKKTNVSIEDILAGAIMLLIFSLYFNLSTYFAKHTEGWILIKCYLFLLNDVLEIDCSRI